MTGNFAIMIEDLSVQLAPGARILGLDVGAKTIGLAISDTTLTVAAPLITIIRSKFSKDLIELTQIIEKNNVFALIVGLPMHLDGSEGRQAQSVRAFARNVAGATGLPVIFWDERLSTVAVERTLLEADVSRKRRAKAIDKLAAAFILQGALERLRNLS